MDNEQNLIKEYLKNVLSNIRLIGSSNEKIIFQKGWFEELELKQIIQTTERIVSVHQRAELSGGALILNGNGKLLKEYLYYFVVHYESIAPILRAVVEEYHKKPNAFKFYVELKETLFDGLQYRIVTIDNCDEYHAITDEKTLKEFLEYSKTLFNLPIVEVCRFNDMGQPQIYQYCFTRDKTGKAVVWQQDGNTLEIPEDFFKKLQEFLG